MPVMDQKFTMKIALINEKILQKNQFPKRRKKSNPPIISAPIIDRKLKKNC